MVGMSHDPDGLAMGGIRTSIQVHFGMSGYRGPEEHDPFVEREDSRGAMNVLLAPVALGGYLLVKGLSSSAFIMAGIGALILLLVALIAYVGWRRSY